MDKLPDVRKIAVLRAIGLGDYLALVPALEALRHAYPDAEIVHLAKPWVKSFLEGRPGPIDRVEVVPVSHGVREEPPGSGLVEDPRALDAFFARMQAERFDLGLQMHGGGRNSNPFVLRLGARFTAGTRTPDAPELDRWIPYVLYQNEVMRQLEVARLVGAEPVTFTPRVTVIDRDREELARALPELRPPYVVLHPGATDPRRRWPPERFAAAGDWLAARGYQVVLTGVEAERDVLAAVLAGMRCPALDAGSRLSVGGLAALLAGAALVISNDTGPMHLAYAVGAPTVAIFWFGNYMNWAHFDRARYRPLFSWTTHCPLCGASIVELRPGTDGCTHDTCFVAGVSLDAVLDAAQDLLGYRARFGAG